MHEPCTLTARNEMSIYSHLRTIAQAGDHRDPWVLEEARELASRHVRHGQERLRTARGMQDMRRACDWFNVALRLHVEGRCEEAEQVRSHAAHNDALVPSLHSTCARRSNGISSATGTLTMVRVRVLHLSCLFAGLERGSSGSAPSSCLTRE